MKIYSSLTRAKEEFAPLEKDAVKIYVCGPTVYDAPHIGHARSAYTFDVIRRYLIYKGWRVTFVRNVTDVDDKIIEKAKKSPGAAADLIEATRKVAEKYLKAYHDDMAILGILAPDREPRATEYIPKMIKFIEGLIGNGRAYAADGDVYFAVKSAKGYGRLSNQNLEKMEAGARIAPGEHKRDPLDFALWKKAKENEPSWDSPWGKGRPGWHIECSAMSSDILGDEFDIHGGGIDLIFPHHENEMAQSEGAGKKFARIWMHNGLLTIDGEKMAKSLGNFISISDFLAKHGDADCLKLLFLSAHYRHPVDYTKAKIDEMKAAKERFLIFIDKVEKVADKAEIADIKKEKAICDLLDAFNNAMDDDFNMPEALAKLFELITLGNTYLASGDIGKARAVETVVLRSSVVLGLSLRRSETVLDGNIEKLIREREKARAKKDFKRSDEIRGALREMGVVLEDTKEGTVWRRSV